MKSILGYTDPLSAAPGEPVQFMVGCSEPGEYRVEILRLICGDNMPGGPGFKTEPVAADVAGTYRGRIQELQVGTAMVAPGAADLGALSSFTIQTVIWPTTPAKGLQGILGRWSAVERRGFALVIDQDGQAALLLSDGQGGTVSFASGARLQPRRWYEVTASFDPASGHARIVQRPLEPWPLVDDAGTRSAPVAIGAPADAKLAIVAGALAVDAVANRTTAHFNGKIEQPRLAKGTLDVAGLDIVAAPRLDGDGQATLIAGWHFGRDVHALSVPDIGPYGLTGYLRNLPIRAVTGHNWSGRDHSWRDAPECYDAMRFHADAMIDAGWEPDFTWQLPAGLRSGIYVARLTADSGEDLIPFFVRPPRGTASAPLAFLVPTATYMAYANYLAWADLPAIEQLNGRLHVADDYDLHLLAHRELGASTYDLHEDELGICHGSRHRPMLTIRPNRAVRWNLNADSHIIDWLEAVGQAYDVITDEDLHSEGLALLGRYRVVMTGTHPEYYSEPMLDAVEAYTRRGGGRLIYMGGNGFYWRIAFHPDLPGVVEVRRNAGTSNWMAAPGEAHHAFDGVLGGTWRSLGRPPNRLVGVGFAAEGFDRSGWYVPQPAAQDPRAAFIFEGVSTSAPFGDHGSIGDGAAGLELDRADPALGTPPHALVLASSTGHSDNYLLVVEDVTLNQPGLGGSEHPDVRADLVFFEAPNGGAVFSVGSIAWAGSLAGNNYDNAVARITGNVLRRFLDPTPFPNAQPR